MKNLYLTLVLSLVWGSLPAQSQVIVQVSAAEDDLEEVLPGSSNTVGTLDAGSSDLELGSENTSGGQPQLVGVRFQGVDIPQGAIILGARIQFTVDEPDKKTDPTVMVIRAQDADNPEAFTTDLFNISTRPTLADSVKWEIAAGSWTVAGESGPDQTTSDITSLVQALVNRSGWAPGNAMVFTFKGTGTRTAESFDGSPTEAAKLIIDFLAPQSLAVQISAADDDLEEALPGSSNTVGSLDAGSSDLELGSENTDGSRPQLIGLRFNNIEIPQGALIADAGIQFTVDEPDKNADPAVIVIRAQDADNPEAFSTESFNISSRPTLADSVVWNIPDGGWTEGAGVAGPNQRTADISALVQALVNRSGWAEGNSMVFTLVGTGTRTAESFDGSPTEAAVLNIRFVPVAEVRNRIATASDDMEEALPGSSNTLGSIDAGSSDLELGSENTDGSRPQLVGLRFTNIDLVKGAQVRSAYIQFTIDEPDKNADPAVIVIRAQDADNPETFTTDAFNVSSRPTLSDSVVWNIPDGGWTEGAGVAGPNQRTVDISSLVQALLNRDGWEPGNSMVFTLAGTGTRTAESFDGSPTEAAELIINVLASEKGLPVSRYPIIQRQPWSYNMEGPSGWTTIDFDDTEWEFGPGALGYGFDNLGTELSAEMKEVYFRKRFNVESLDALTEQLALSLRVEDAAEVYINGTLASMVSATEEGAAEETYFLYTIDKTLLLEGTNVIAVKVTSNEGDLVFDASLDNLELTLANQRVECPDDDNYISCFTSLLPIAQNDFIGIPVTHEFQYIAREDEPYTDGPGAHANNFDFTGYVPIDGSSTHGYLSINYENEPGGVSITEVHLNPSTGLWETLNSRPVDFSSVVGTARNCSGTVTPWGTIISCEETTPDGDADNDGYTDIGWCVEIDPVTASVVDYGNGPEKLWALGRMSHENVVIADDRRTVYFGEDEGDGSVYKFVADQAEDLSSGELFVLKLDGEINSDFEATTATGTWVKVPNQTRAQRNAVKAYALNTAGATTFSGVEDVEISPIDGMIYFAVKGNAGKVYRFKDDGATFSGFETFVGGKPYVISADGKQVVADWFGGQDNLTFDDRGNLYVLQDGGNNYIWLVGANHTQDNPAVEIFFHTPNGAEPTGMTFTPDFRYMFMSVQHPSASTPQADVTGRMVPHDKDVAIVISREEFLGGKKIVDSEKEFNLFYLGSYRTGIFDGGAAEIVAYDASTSRAFFVNADANTVSVLDISRPNKPELMMDIDMSPYGGGVNSVAIKNGIVAVAVEADSVQENGNVVFFDTDGNYLNDVEVGALPDMVIFTNDGTKVLTANEGEPNDEYTIDPEGSVSIIDISAGVAVATVKTVGFTSFNADSTILRNMGVRIFGPGATVAQDLEPEYIAILDDDSKAYVSLQENNALAVIDIAGGTVDAIVPLGYKDHRMFGNAFDASNRSDSIEFKSWPVLGMYQPDAIKAVNIGGMDYIVSANEGDARDYDGFSEEERVGDLPLDPVRYPNFTELQLDENLGRLNSTTATGDSDGDGDIDQIYSYGARSFSVWDATGKLIFDSGDHIERKLAELEPDNFNSTNDENDSFKNRSDDKGPEPEAVEIVKMGNDVFALIGLERIGGIMVYDITDPTAPEYVNYVNNRNFTVEDATSPEVGDLGIEDIKYISAEDSPVGVPLVLTANEISGTISVFAVNEIPDLRNLFTLRILHNNDGESKLEPRATADGLIGGAANFKTVVDSLRALDMNNILLSSGDNYLAGISFNASLNRAPGQSYYDAEVLDALNYDAIAIGNHDFDFGPDVLEKMILDFKNSMPPYLSANLDFSGEPGLQALVDNGRIAARTVLDVDGEKIGVIGLIYDNVNTITSLRNVKVDTALIAIAQQQIDELLMEGVNKIILITHLQSINRELELIGELTDVDIVIAGGGDEYLTNNEAATNYAGSGFSVYGEYPLKEIDAAGDTVYVVTTPGEYRYVGNLMIGFDSTGKVAEIFDGSDLVLVRGGQEDSLIQATIVDSVTAYAAGLDQNIIATTEVDLDGTRGNVRTIETNQGNLIADAFLFLATEGASEYGLDPSIPIVAVQNGGGIRNDEIIPAGSQISEKKTFDMLPFDNTLIIMNPIDPVTFKSALENAVSAVNNVDGRFLQIAGFTVVWDTAGTPDQNRIVSVRLDDGTSIVENYEVVGDAPSVYIATNNFTAGGGDSFDEFADAGILAFLPYSYQRALYDYLIRGINGTITAEDYPAGGEGRIQKLFETAVENLDLNEFGFNVSPNPFETDFRIQYELTTATRMDIRLMDIQGRMIRNIVSDLQQSGSYSYTVNQERLANSVYYIVVNVDGRTGSIPVVKQ